jgi:Penicillin amidase
LSRALSSGVAVALACLFPAVSPAAAQVAPFGHDTYGNFNDVLPPGSSGLVNLLALVPAELGVLPPHSSDQLAMYGTLTTAAPHIRASQLGEFFKSSAFGVPTGQLAKSETPEPGVTIEWDSQYAVPHVYGDTRAELMYGIGWASAEDRLFLMDALRHAGQGELAQFAGGSNVAMDEAVWSVEPYTHQDLVNQVEWGESNLPDGHQIFDDAQRYVDGLNAYIERAQNPLFTPTMMPAEYTALGIKPRPFTVEDLVSIASLIGGLFGVGGGDQLKNALLYEQMLSRFGGERHNVPGLPRPVAHPRRRGRRTVDHSGFATFMSFDDPGDPEAPTTIRGTSFPYQTLPMPSRAVARTIALPDAGSVRYVDHLVAGAIPPGQVQTPFRRGLLAVPRSMSNALLVSARDTADGHPVAVMGPQVSYFSPEILMEQDIHGPGIDAAGAAFPGVNFYVELGRGPDYAWSATSAGQNIVDTFAVPLCNPAGGRVAPSSDYYLLHDHCVAMETLTDHESWSPTLADSTRAGSATFSTERTAYGLVIARATVRGRPVAYTNLRSTYMHELDSAVGLERFNEPQAMRGPHAFFDAADHIGYTFNWFYADDRHIAYFNSGQNPLRAPHTDPLFPAWSQYAWPGYGGGVPLTPAGTTERDTPEAGHPHTVDQAYLTSWNNKQAPGYDDAATAQEFSSIFRSQLLDRNLEHYLVLTHNRITLTDLVNAMGNAGTQDLRGVEVLPYALDIIGSPNTQPLAGAVSELLRWVASGAHRINRRHPGASGRYDQSDAVRIMDAWWPLLVRAEFGPVLGSTLLAEVERSFPIDDQPGHGVSASHAGSAYDVGFYGIVQKDLRAVLRRHVAGPLNRVFCGGGSLTACRTALESSLALAAAESLQQVYPADGVCHAGDQMCSDSIKFRAAGAIKQPLIEWVNRPTFQQADEITGHIP